MRCLALAALTITAALNPIAASAQDSGGLSSMHEQRRESGRVCMSDHFHYGSGAGKSKPAALADAISSWQSFTDLEYGGSWSSWKRSASKQVTYADSSGGVSADVSARPCR